MILEQLVVGFMGVCSYIVGCEETREGLVVDPGGEVERILATARGHGLEIRTVVNTHAHVDHIVGNADLVGATGAKLAAHEVDARTLRGAFKQLAGLFLQGSPSPRADVLLADGDRIRVGKTVEIEVIHTPGHTPGSICLLAGRNLFTGDTLFVGGVGRTDLPGGSWRELERSVRQRLYVLPDETIVWPGHNYGPKPHSTIGDEKRTNPCLPGEE